MSEQRTEIVHPCCGCSCHVCEHGHAAGSHSDACSDRFWQEQANVDAPEPAA